MSIIKCPECGKDVSDKAKYCIHCGFPIEEYVSENRNDKQSGNELNGSDIKSDTTELNENEETLIEKDCVQGDKGIKDKDIQDNKSKINETLILIFGILGAVFGLFLIGIIPAVVALILAAFAYTKEKWSPKIAVGVVCAIIGILLFTAMVHSMQNKPANSKKNDEQNASEIASTMTTQQADDKNSTDTYEETTTMEDANDQVSFAGMNQTSDNDDEEIYYEYLIKNIDNYDGQTVRFSAPVTSIYSDSIRIKSYDGSIEIETDTQGMDEDTTKYVTVSGTLVKTDTYVDAKINDAKIEYAGIDKPNGYDEVKAKYEDIQTKQNIAARDKFIKSATKVTYDDLRRYPDKYKDKPLKMKIKIKEAKPDGFIFQGDIFAIFDGSEIAVYDGRATREPRFLNGDKITVYATGDGLTKVQEKNGTGLFAKVIKEYEIPMINVIYTDNDSLDEMPAFGTDESNDNSDAYNAGRQAAEKLNDVLDGQ